MKGFGYNILNDKTGIRKGLSLKAVRAWAYWLSAQWPYASTRQISRQQRQMAKRLRRSTPHDL